MACRDDQWLTSGRLLNLLKHAEQRNVIAAELATVGRHAVVLVVDRVGCHGQMMRHRRQAIPTACIGDTYEQRKHPQPEHSRGEQLAMATKQTRHEFFSTFVSTHCQATGAS